VFQETPFRDKSYGSIQDQVSFPFAEGVL
jgi:hypothetical protein